MRTLFLLATISVCACQNGVKAAKMPRFPTLADPTLNPSDDQDFATMEDRFAASIARKKPDARLAESIAAELSRRVGIHVKRRELWGLETDAKALADFLWQAKTHKLELPASHVSSLRQAIERIGSAGQVESTFCLLHSLEAIGVATQEEKNERIAIREYADALLVATNGQDAALAGTIRAQEAALDCAAETGIAARLARNYLLRLSKMQKLLSRPDPDIKTIEAHGQGLVQTSWRIARAFARAGEPQLAKPFLQPLASSAEAAAFLSLLARMRDRDADDESSANSWIKFASLFNQPRKERVDPRARIAVLKRGEVSAAMAQLLLARRPSAANVYAKKAKQTPMAIQAHIGEMTRAMFAGRWLLAGSIRDRAMAQAKTLPAKAQLKIAPIINATYQLGRLSVGFAESLGPLPSFDANIVAAQIATARGQFKRAHALLDTSESMIAADAPGNVLRHAARANLLTAQNQPQRAQAHWQKAVTFDLDVSRPDKIDARILATQAQGLWHLSRPRLALRLFEGAFAYAKAPGTYLRAQADFFAQQTAYNECLATFHAAMYAQRVSRSDRLYIGLRVMALGRFFGRPSDPSVVRLLQAASGSSWHDNLAHMAVGKKTAAQLLPLTTTPRRRAQWLFYRASFDTATPKQKRPRMKQLTAAMFGILPEVSIAKAWAN